LQNRIRILFSISLVIIVTSIIAQTPFIKSATLPAYSLNICGGKDEGYAWANYDLDRDYNLTIKTNGRGYLLRNDGAIRFIKINGNLSLDFLYINLYEHSRF